MKKTADFLDEVKRKKGITSDYALAKVLGVRTQRIDHYRKERVVLQLLDCITISEILNIPALQIMAEIGISQGKKEEEKKRWVDFLKRAPGIAAAVALIVLVLGGAPQTSIDDGLIFESGKGVEEFNSLYIMRSATHLLGKAGLAGKGVVSWLLARWWARFRRNGSAHLVTT